jgi:hypothetical protein
MRLRIQFVGQPRIRDVSPLCIIFTGVCIPAVCVCVSVCEREVSQSVSLCPPAHAAKVPSGFDGDGDSDHTHASAVTAWCWRRRQRRCMSARATTVATNSIEFQGGPDWAPADRTDGTEVRKDATTTTLFRRAQLGLGLPRYPPLATSFGAATTRGARESGPILLASAVGQRAVVVRVCTCAPASGARELRLRYHARTLHTSRRTVVNAGAREQEKRNAISWIY